jgi:hypothetical protein
LIVAKMARSDVKMFDSDNLTGKAAGVFLTCNAHREHIHKNQIKPFVPY